MKTYTFTQLNTLAKAKRVVIEHEGALYVVREFRVLAPGEDSNMEEGDVSAVYVNEFPEWVDMADINGLFVLTPAKAKKE